MNAKRITTHLSSVVILLLWGGVMLYFHLSGRMAAYLPQTGIFRPMALYAGVILVALGLINLATMGSDDVMGATEPDEAEGHAHKEGASCCGCHAAKAAQDEETTSGSGRWLAMLILVVPLLVAAVVSPDRFSPAAIINKGVYTAKYDSGKAPASSRLTKATPSTTKTVAAPAPTVQSSPPPAAPPTAAGTVATTPSAGPRVPGSAAPATSSVVVTTLPPSAGAPPAASMAPGAPPAATPPTPAPAAAAASGKSYGNFTLEDLKAQVPQSKEGNFILEVPELYYTAGDKEVQGVLAGQPVETTAQVLPEKVNNADGRRLRVFRLLVQCCASDARPYSVPVEFADKAPVLKEMSWVKVVGKMAYRQEGGQTVPLIEAISLKETSAPDNAMLY